MFTVKSALEQLNDHEAILERMRKILRRMDSEYPQVEDRYHEGIRDLKESLSPEGQSSLDKIIDLENERMAADFLFLSSKGYNQNLACFQDPMQRKFLDLDFEDIHDESIMEGMQANEEYRKCADSFYGSLTPEQQKLASSIRDYYSYLETTAYKLAHYMGFRMGDEVLPLVVPGYRPNTALTHAYRHKIYQQLGVSLEKLEG